MENTQQKLYWRQDLGPDVSYTFEKMALEYREDRVNGDVVFFPWKASAPAMTFREILRSERELQMLIGEESLPETLDEKRNLLEEFRHRWEMFRKVVHNGDFSHVEFIRRLEKAQTEYRNQCSISEQTELSFQEECRKNAVLQRELAVACSALRDVAAGFEYSLNASLADRERLAGDIRKHLQTVLENIGDEKSKIADTQEAVAKLMIIYQTEQSSKARIQETYNKAQAAIRQQEDDIDRRNVEFGKYCRDRSQLFDEKKREAISLLSSYIKECNCVASEVGRLRNQLETLVRFRINPAWRVWVAGVGKGIPVYRRLIATYAFGPTVAPGDILAIADATVCGTGWHGVVLTVQALHVRDNQHHAIFPWEKDLSIVVESSKIFEMVLRVKDQRFTFRMPYFGVFVGFLGQLSDLCRNIQVPEWILKSVMAVHAVDVKVNAAEWHR